MKWSVKIFYAHVDIDVAVKELELTSVSGKCN